MPSVSFDITLEDTIVEACAQHFLKISSHSSNYRLCLVVDGFFVKFNSYVNMYPEYETLKYISRCAKNDINAPRVPEIVHFFHRRDHCLAYLVMENINLTPPPEDFHERVAKAIQWLRKCPVPPDGARLGPLGGGVAHHELFGESKAPLKFSSTLALERFLNTAITMLPPKGRSSTAPIRISHEQLVFTQSDMDESNFGIDDQGRTCLFDFTTVGLLPESLASYTMSLRMPFTKAVAQCLDWSPTPNLQSMSRIARVLAMSSGTLGLDEDGNPINPISFRRRRKRIRKNEEASGEARSTTSPSGPDPAHNTPSSPEASICQ